MALAPYTAPALPSDSPVVAAWIAAHVAALPKGAKLREVLRGRTPSGAFVRVVAWRAGGQPSLRVDDGSYGGEADFTGDPTPEAVRRVLGKAEPLAAWEDPRVSRGPTAPGVWLHAAGRDAHPIGTPALADVARRGLVLLVRDDGAATSGAPDHLSRPPKAGEIAWVPAESVVGQWVPAAGLHRDELSSPTWPAVLAALERWGAADAAARGAATAAEPLKIGQVIPASTNPPLGCVVRVKGGPEDSAVFRMGRDDSFQWLVSRTGHPASHTASLRDMRDDWRPQSFEVLALGVPAAWDARSARALAGVDQAEKPRPWTEVPEDCLARNAQGLCAWKRADVFVRCWWNGALGFCDEQGPWTLLTGPHRTPDEVDEAARLLLEHGRLEPEAAAPQAAAPAARAWKVGDEVRTAEEVAALPPGAILREGPNAETRDLVAVLRDRTMSYLRRAEESPPGTAIALEDGWTGDSLVEKGPVEVVALADPARLGDSAYMCELLGWSKPAAEPAPLPADLAHPLILGAASPTTALSLQGADVRLTIIGPDGKPFELKGLGSGDFVSLEAPGALRVTLAPEAAQALAALASDVGDADGAVAAQAPRGDAVGVAPGDQVPWERVPPGSLVLDEDGDPIWRKADGAAWHRIGIDHGERWRKVEGAGASAGPVSARRCTVLRVGVPDDAQLGDLVGWAAASGFAPDARAAVDRLPAEQRARAIAVLGGGGDGGGVAVAAEPQGVSLARAVLGDAVREVARLLEAGGAATVYVKDAVARRWVEGVGLALAEDTLRVGGGCACARCAALPARDVPLPQDPKGRLEAALVAVAEAPGVACRLAPWGAVQAMLAATPTWSPTADRPAAWPAADSTSRAGAPLLRALGGRGAVGQRSAEVGGFSLREVEPWTWEVRADVRVDASSPVLAALVGRRVVAVSAAVALREVVRGTALALSDYDEDRARCAATLSTAQRNDALGPCGNTLLAQMRSGVRGLGVQRAYVVLGDGLLALPRGGWLRARGSGVVLLAHADLRPGGSGAATAAVAQVHRALAATCATWADAPGRGLTCAVVGGDGSLAAQAGTGPRLG